MIRNKGLIKGLKENDFQVDFLTLPVREDDQYFDDSIDISNHVNVIYAQDNKLYNSLVKNDKTIIGKIKRIMLPSLRKVYHSISLFDNTIHIAKKIDLNALEIDYYDLIISSSDPKTSHIAVHQLIKSGLKYGKWIQYWGDPLTLDITNKSILPNAYIKKIEKQIMSHADQIVYVSPFTLRAQKKLFPNYNYKMTFVPIPYLEEKLYDNGTSDNPKLGYFGDYNSNIRNLYPFYETCINGNYQCVIAGNSNLELSSSNNVTVLPRISQKQVGDYEKDCDILVCVLNKRGTQIPGKIYHFAATNKPVLVILDGEKEKEIEEYLSQFERFVMCENNIENITKAIEKIRQSNLEYHPSPYFKPQKIVKDILDLL